MTATRVMSSRLRPQCHVYYVLAATCPPSDCGAAAAILSSCAPIYSGEVVLCRVAVLHFQLDICLYRNIIQLTDMRQARTNRANRAVDAKAGVLGQHGALHLHPEHVQDEAFQRNEFFDPRDLVQVRYEMLRRRQVDGQPVTDVAAAFGVSRQAFYVTEAAFAQKGIVGLLPRPRGPQRAHKCTDEILDFVEQWSADSSTRGDIGEVVRKRFGVAIHPRSLARALARRKKKQL